MTTKADPTTSGMHDMRSSPRGGAGVWSGYSTYKIIKDLLAVCILILLVVMNYLNISVIHVFDKQSISSNQHTGPEPKKMQLRMPLIPAKTKRVTPKKAITTGIHNSSRIRSSKILTTSQSHLLVEPNDKIYRGDLTGFNSAPIVDEKHKLLFFSVPKVACTTFKFLFRRIRGVSDWDAQDSMERKGLPHNPEWNNLKYLYHYPIETANEMMTSPEWTRAIFVRDPKTRFLSAFLDKSVGNYGSFVTERCCPDAMKCMLDNYPEIPAFMAIKSCQVEGWDSRKNTIKAMWLEGKPCCSVFKECQEKTMNVEGFLETIETCHDEHWGK